MIVAIYGTTGELIKLAPVLRQVDGRSDLLTLTTAQQVQQIPTMLDDFGLPRPDLYLGHGNGGVDLERKQDIPPWAVQVWRRFAHHRSALRRRLAAAATRPLVLVHGDTLTTVFGALMGRALGVPVAHIEAGLRSGDWRNPFPEELDRRITSKLATLHYAPGAWAAGNLRSAGVRGVVVDTQGNTIRDALELVPATPVGVDLPSEPFGVASLHRFELLGNGTEFEAVLRELRAASRRTPILFIDHPVTAAAVDGAGLAGLFDHRFRRVPRQRYFAFISLLKASQFLVTDSGGSQEECAHLGHPCLVHRAATERQDGLDGGPVVLSRMDLEVLRRFLADPRAHARPPKSDVVRPTAVITADLLQRGHLRA